MHDLEKRMMVKQDDNTRVAIYVDWLKKNVPKVGDLPEGGQEKAFDDAALHVRKFCTMFGDPVDTKYTSGDDRPLPYELKIRVNNYVQKRRSDTNFLRDIMESSTFNALVRKEIAAGRL